MIKIGPKPDWIPLLSKTHPAKKKITTKLIVTKNFVRNDDQAISSFSHMNFSVPLLEYPGNVNFTTTGRSLFVVP